MRAAKAISPRGLASWPARGPHANQRHDLQPLWPAPIDDELAQLAALVDEAGTDSVFVADHLMQADHLVQAERGTEPSEPMLEALTTLGPLAARATQVRLGTMVASAALRPALLRVMAVTTLDALSLDEAATGEYVDCAVSNARWMPVARSRVTRSRRRRGPRS